MPASRSVVPSKSLTFRVAPTSQGVSQKAIQRQKKDEMSLISSLNSRDAPNCSNQVDVNLFFAKILRFVHDMFLDAWINDISESACAEMFALIYWMAHNALTMPVDGFWPVWYLDLCYSARSKEVQGILFTFAMPHTEPTDNFPIPLVLPPVQQDYTFTFEPGLYRSVSYRALTELEAKNLILKFLNLFDSIDARDYRPRHKDCVSIAAVTTTRFGWDRQPWMKVVLEVPIKTNWIAGISAGWRGSLNDPVGKPLATNFFLERLPIAGSGMAYYVRNKCTKYVGKTIFKLYDVNEILQDFMCFLERTGPIDSSVGTAMLKLFYGALLRKFSPFQGLNLDNHDCYRAGVYQTPPSWVGSCLVPKPLADKIAECSPRIVGGYLHLPYFGNVVPRVVASFKTFTPYFERPKAYTGYQTYNNWSPALGFAFNMPFASPLANYSECVTVDSIEFIPLRSTITISNVLLTLTNERYVRSRYRLGEVTEFLLTHWVPTIDPIEDNDVAPDFFVSDQETFRYPNTRWYDDQYLRSQRYVQLVAASTAVSVPNLPPIRVIQREDVVEKLRASRSIKRVSPFYRSSVMSAILPFGENDGSPTFDSLRFQFWDENFSLGDDINMSYLDHDLSVLVSSSVEEVQAAHQELQFRLLHLTSECPVTQTYHRNAITSLASNITLPVEECSMSPLIGARI